VEGNNTSIIHYAVLQKIRVNSLPILISSNKVQESHKHIPVLKPLLEKMLYLQYYSVAIETHTGKHVNTWVVTSQLTSSP